MNNKAGVKTILLLAANPRDTSKLQLDVEVREIDEGLRRANKREQFKLEQKWAVRSRDFYRAILDTQPQIVHFCGHGTAEDGIILENEMKQSVYVQADALASMFKLFATKGVECVVLNACYSEVQAEAISQYVKYVIGMNKAVGDKAAVAFAVAFYDALGAGEDVEFAYELGKSQMIGFMEHQTPVLKKNQLTDVSTTFETDVIPPNPYQGLSAFGEEDAAFFFGRETFVNELVQTTRKQPLVGVVGPSGSGKSSVVFAGLIPQLRGEGNWLISSFRPGNQPFYQLACALVRLLEPEVGETQQLREAAGLAGDMQSGRISLQQVASRIQERNGGKRLLLVADQFEELYTLCQKEEQEGFADAILAAISPEMTLVFTLRADFYGYVLSYRPFRDALQQFTPQLLSSMKREELKAAIALPAQKLDVQLEAQLTQRILDDVGQEPGNLPLLEFALTRLWEKQENRVLTHQAYDEIGGVKKAIANHAELVYQQLSETQQKQAERIFVQLVRPGEGTEDTRRMATRGEVGEDNWGLVSYLAGYQARLVVTGGGKAGKAGEAGGAGGAGEVSFAEDTVEVVHEALIREWGTLRKWINANREFRTWQERLKVGLREWKNSNHDSGALLRGVPLTVASDWLHKRAEEMTQEERDFIQVSGQQRDREKQQEKRRRQQTIFGLTGGFVGALMLAGFGFWQLQQAEKNQLGQIEALANYSTELRNRGQYFDALIEALRAAKPLRSKNNPSMQVVATLSQAVYVDDIRERNRLQHNAPVIRVAFSPDGKTLVSGSADNTIKIWDLTTLKAKTLTGHRDRGL
jgi:energy-coupling factor transporter ATP-binding protein EcfA2